MLQHNFIFTIAIAYRNRTSSKMLVSEVTVILSVTSVLSQYTCIESIYMFFFHIGFFKFQ